MNTDILAKLEQKIESAIETIELQKMQIEELENERHALEDLNNKLVSKQKLWENNLATMLDKLEKIDETNEFKIENNSVETLKNMYGQTEELKEEELEMA